MLILLDFKFIPEELHSVSNPAKRKKGNLSIKSSFITLINISI
jgi:hypothetical protein